VTLLDALSAVRHAYDEDDAEREAILELLAPILLGTKPRLTSAIMTAWPDAADEIREALGTYQAERARIDHESALADAAARGDHAEYHRLLSRGVK